ncbi:MAG TPA: SCO family protein [Pseudolabrys sp.]|nr:SCO family protein [Pseudolabrys sp.]
MRLACWLAAVVVAAGAYAPHAASAAVSPEEYRKVGISLPVQARLPLAERVIDSSGRSRPLRDFISRPTVLVLADYTCRTLCGPVIDFVATALEQSGLDAEGFALLVVGLDPKDNTQQANRMRAAHFPPGSKLTGTTEFVTSGQDALNAIVAALGYRAVYDEDDDVFVHPAAAYVLTTEGTVSRVLSGVGITGNDMRLALTEASGGRIGTLGDRVRVLCSHFDPRRGTYDLVIWQATKLAAFGGALAFASFLLVLYVLGRRRAS